MLHVPVTGWDTALNMKQVANAIDPERNQPGREEQSANVSGEGVHKQKSQTTRE
jgi:hypothetical protein